MCRVLAVADSKVGFEEWLCGVARIGVGWDAVGVGWMLTISDLSLTSNLMRNGYLVV